MGNHLLLYSVLRNGRKNSSGRADFRAAPSAGHRDIPGPAPDPHQALRTAPIPAPLRQTPAAVPPTMEPGQQQLRVDPRCRCDIEVYRPSITANGNPRCCCGAEMKEPDGTPGFRRLDAKPAAFDFEQRKKRGA